MVKTIDVRTALYGIHYDLALKLEQTNDPMIDLEWLQHRIEKLRMHLMFIENYNSKRRKNMSRGLTGSDLWAFEQLVIKANDQQVEKLENRLSMELRKRTARVIEEQYLEG